jgi:hypothetical protein
MMVTCKVLSFAAFYPALAAVQINISIRLLFIAVCSLAPSHAQSADAPGKPRVALVMGNSRYEATVGPLRNTVNDAKAMAKSLRTLGFTVIEEHDVTRDELMVSLMKFRGMLKGAEVGLFYFAGHGISVSGANYLMPVKSGYSPDLAEGGGLKLLAETKLFNAEQAVAEMSNSGVGCNIVILDACRTTPVARNPVERDAVRGGLVEMNPPAGSLIAFATDAGRSASDGDGKNGLYTEQLIKHLLTPGLTIEQVFKRTRAGVIEKSEGKQVPAEYSRLIGDDVFLAGREVPKAIEEAIPKGEPIPLPTPAVLAKLAATGDSVRTIEAIRRLSRSRGPGNEATVPLATLLEHVKESLREPKSAPARAEDALRSCEHILAAIIDCVAEEDPLRKALSAKAHNRRGDALLLLSRNEDALAAYNAALALAPDDAYIFYNRGRAQLAMGRTDDAKADFAKAIEAKPKQSGARKLAQEALAELK